MSFDKVTEILDEQVRIGRVAGNSMLVLKDGKEVYYHEVGYANLAEQKPFRRDAIVRLYSMTKPITAVAGLQLIEQGKLSFSMRVDDILPAYRDLYIIKDGQRVKTSARMTVKDLFDMTCGLTYGGALTEGRRETQALFDELQERMFHADDDENPPMTTREFADRLAGCALEFAPGTAWKYGTGADVLGAVIEVISKESLEDYFQNHIFKPLGMKDTSFFVPEEKADRIPMSYNDTHGYLKERHSPALGVGKLRDHLSAPAFQSGGAGLYGTIDDYARFGTMLLNGGRLNGVQILGERMVRYLTESELTPMLQESYQKEWRKQAGFTYATLVRKCIHPEQAFFLARKGEYGWGGALGTKFYNLPNEKVTIVYFTQLLDGEQYGYHEAIRNMMDDVL